MIEKSLVLLVFLLCIAMMVNLLTEGALRRWAIKAWRRLRDWPAARRRRIYQLNEFRATRERGQSKARSTSDH